MPKKVFDPNKMINSGSSNIRNIELTFPLSYIELSNELNYCLLKVDLEKSADDTKS